MQLILNPSAIKGVLKDVQGTEFVLHADGTIALLSVPNREWTKEKDGNTYYKVVFNLADASAENKSMLAKVLGPVEMGVAKHEGKKQVYTSRDESAGVPAPPERLPDWVLPAGLGLGVTALVVGGVFFLRRRR